MNRNALNHSVEYISSWLAYRYDQSDVPGYAVAISYKGDLVFSEAYGYANLENKTRLTKDHIFRIASHSKTFTATALMQLQEKGKLRIDDYVIDYLPWLKEHTDTRWQKVTVRQLMSHGAGVIRDGLNADYWQLERGFPNETELKSEILEAKLVIDTNLKIKYSNFGYSLLGLVVEALSGESYNDYVSKHIVKPLGLDSTGPEYTKAIDNRIVTGYSRREHKTRLPIAQVDTKAMSAATGFYSNAEDLCKYFTAQMVGSKKLLSDESKKEMQRVQYHAEPRNKHAHVDYGLGIDIEYFGKRKLIGHSGGFPGHITISLADPKDELVVVVLTNFLDSPAGHIAKGIYDIIDYYQKSTMSAKPKHDLRNLEGRYANLWGVTDIVVTANKIVGISPNSWQPFSAPEKLEYVNETTLKIVDTSSFDSEDELVHFNLKNGKVKSVIYGGFTMLPLEDWDKMQTTRKFIGQS